MELGVRSMDKTDKSGEVSVTKPVLVARDFLLIAILLMVIVFLWIGFGVYKNLTSSQVPEPIRETARPIKVEFPREVFENLKQRKNYRDMDLNESDRVILNEAGELVVLIAGLVGGAVLVRQRQQVQPRAAAGGEPVDLVIGNISDQSFSVSWTTAEQVAGGVLLGTRRINDVRDLKTKLSEATTHLVTVDGLEQAKGYEFRVESGGEEYDSQGRPFAVTTAVSLGGSLPVSDV